MRIVFVVVIGSVLGCNRVVCDAAVDDDLLSVVTEECRDAERTAQEEFMASMRVAKDSRARKVLRSIQKQDRWLLPLVGALMRRRGSTLAAEATDRVWELFPAAALRLSEEALPSADRSTAIHIAKELSRHGYISAPAQDILENLCSQLPSRSWGIMFLDSRGDHTSLPQSLRMSGTKEPWAQVAYVCADYWAGRSGLRGGDVVIEVNGRIVRGTDAFKQVRDSSVVMLVVYRGPNRMTFFLERPSSSQRDGVRH